MNIRKFNHSCLLVEENETAILIDPGNYSESVLDLNNISKLDYVLITHEHLDHCFVPLIKSVIAKFPQVQIITNNSVKELLAKENILATTEENEDIQITPVPHEKIWGVITPLENIMFTLLHKLSHPGDSLTFIQSAEILALPISGPWASTTWAVETALKVKPKVIIPIHDWHWKDEVRKSMHKRLAEYFHSQGIDFRPIEVGDTIEI